MKPNIIIEAGLTGNKYNGHYHYCKNLGIALNKRIAKLYNLCFLVKNNNTVFHIPQPAKIFHYSWYKYLYRFFNKAKVWHITYQLTDIMPFGNDVPVLLTIHDLNFLIEDEPAEITNKLKEIQRNIDRSSAIVAISNYVKKDIEQHLDLKGKQVTVIYNGCNVDETQIESLKERNDKQSYPSNQYIYTLGVVCKKKNLHILPYLLTRNDLKLVITGFIQDPAYQKYIQEVARELHVEDRVIFTGPVSEEDKLCYIRDCAIFAFPSLAEGFGLPVIEAMRFGKKTLLSKYTCLPEIGGPFAFYLDSDEPDYLKKFAMSDLPKILEKDIDENKVREWAQQFSWDHAAVEYKKIYRSLIKN
jgi:glycosyltransferase involved in cell wall biosynthesis